MAQSGFAAPLSNPVMNPDHALCARVLFVLADAAPRSLENLATQLDVSVADAQAALALLERSGLSLLREAQGSVRLPAPFVPLHDASIMEALTARGLDAEVLVRPMLDSTNSVLMQRARGHGRPIGDRLIILAAELQYAGRGRLGRAWSSQAGSSLTVSFARELPLAAADLPGLSLMCGLAAREALAGFGAAVELKWPNDLLWQRRKLGGILVEVLPVDASCCRVVIGIGLNVTTDPTRVSVLAATLGQGLPATDLVSAGLGAPVDRNLLVAALAGEIQSRLEAFVDHGFGPYIDTWNAYHAYRDEPVEMVEHGAVVQSGIARGVDSLGRLCLDTPAGVQSVLAGDLSLRPR